MDKALDMPDRINWIKAAVYGIALKKIHLNIYPIPLLDLELGIYI